VELGTGLAVVRLVSGVLGVVLLLEGVGGDAEDGTTMMTGSKDAFTADDTAGLEMVLFVEANASDENTAGIVTVGCSEEEGIIGALVGATVVPLLGFTIKLAFCTPLVVFATVDTAPDESTDDDDDGLVELLLSLALAFNSIAALGTRALDNNPAGGILGNFLITEFLPLPIETTTRVKLPKINP